ncbi:MAG: hypothetical protein K2X72_36350, partial [Reyranella sp.]|nr:hypothetical protein [Reyranella sp.]
MRSVGTGLGPERRVGLSRAAAWLSLVLMSSTALTAIAPLSSAWADGGNGGDGSTGTGGAGATGFGGPGGAGTGNSGGGGG